MKRGYLIAVLVAAGLFGGAVIASLTGGPRPADADAGAVDATGASLSNTTGPAARERPAATPPVAASTEPAASRGREPSEPASPGVESLLARVRQAQAEVDRERSAVTSDPPTATAAPPPARMTSGVAIPSSEALSVSTSEPDPGAADPVSEAVAAVASAGEPSPVVSNERSTLASSRPAAAATDDTTTPAATRPTTTATPPAAGRPATTDPSSPSSEPSPARDATYTIRAGDTFESVAIALYGNGRYWDEIAQANPLVDPQKLRVGQVIRLPERLDDGRDVDQVAAPGETVRYTVRPGDTLSDIAQQYYGRASRWRYLYNTNRAVIGPNPNALQAGDVLTVRPYPEPAR